MQFRHAPMYDDNKLILFYSILFCVYKSSTYAFISASLEAIPASVCGVESWKYITNRKFSSIQYTLAASHRHISGSSWSFFKIKAPDMTTQHI